MQDSFQNYFFIGLISYYKKERGSRKWKKDIFKSTIYTTLTSKNNPKLHTTRF